MTVDPFSPVAPGRLSALLLPIGNIRRSRFLGFAKRLQAQNVVRLGDVSPDGRTNRNSFSPLAFPSGTILYDLSTSISPSTHLELFPFETFREPLVILALADGAELSNNTPSAGEAPRNEKPNGAVSDTDSNPAGLEDLTHDLEILQDKYPRSLVRQLLVFDYEGVESPLMDSEGICWVPSSYVSRSTTVKTVMCDITALVLKELDSFAESLEDWPTIQSPKTLSWGPRSTSESRPADKLQHRMTMPAQLPSRPNGLSNKNSESPPESTGHESPTTFDEITRSIQLAGRAETLKSSSKPGSKEHSRERKSTQGVGSVDLSDRAKTKFKGRLRVVVGSLYLQAGLWPDAIKELVEGASIARAGSDYIWHAKALETILLCLLMFGWAGMDFQIPQVCYPAVDKPAKATSSDTTSGQSNSENRAASLQSLAKLLPDISAQILNLYTRATNITDEPLPQSLFSETVIRLARLLSVTCVRDGVLDDDGLKHLVMNHPLKPNRNMDRSKGDVTLSKTDITSFLFRALPLSPPTDIPVTDSVPILTAMASVLSTLGLDRKRAFILKEMISVLIPGLVQARKVGAAEMGIHPAAGLLALNNANFDVNALDVGQNDLAESMRALLYLVGDTYGVEGIAPPDSEAEHTEGDGAALVDDSIEAITQRAIRYIKLRAYGDVSLKIELLKLCINLCEALPDFHGVLQFTVDLLRTTKGAVMLPPGRVPPPALGQDEQVRLYNNVKRTVGAASMLGSPDLQADYWDDFLLRGIELASLSGPQVPVRRSKKASIEETATKSPFIYNAFAKTAVSRSESVLVAGEYAEFKVTLQNPFEFDMEVESVKVEGEGVEFQAAVEGLWLAPLSLQERIIPVLATSEGTLRITGCFVKVRFCKARRFPLFRQFWKPKLESKLKRMGLAAKEPLSERPESWGSNASSSTSEPDTKGPETETLTLNVIKQQPILVIDSTSLTQSAIMVLEGETKSFDITLHNVSSCPVDLIHFTFQDSATRQLRSALLNKDNLPADVYELESQLVTKPVLRYHGDNDGSVTIPPGAKSTFTFDILGKPGLYDAEVQIDYGHIAASPSDLPESFYVRQIVMPLTVTVNASAEIVRCDLFPLSGDLAYGRSSEPSEGNQPSSEGSVAAPEASSSALSSSGLRESQFSAMLSRLESSPAENGYCLLLLDIRNNWPNPLSVSIYLNEAWQSTLGSSDCPVGENLPESTREIMGEIQPGHISRIPLVIPRMSIDDPRRPIPSLNSEFKRQFVVSAHKLSPDAEVTTREVFWYREELLKHIRGSWSDHISRREGAIELRSLRLNERIIDTLSVEDVDMKFTLGPWDATPKNGQDTRVVQTGLYRYTVQTNTFLQLRVTITNRSRKAIHPLVRLQPCLRNQPHSVALELSKRLAWTGMLQRALPVLGAGDSAETTLALTVLCRGEYEIGASVEEIRGLKPHASTGAEERTEKPLQVSGPFQEAFEISVPKQRRVWHSRIPCTISAQD